jgi:hypothetical protein
VSELAAFGAGRTCSRLYHVPVAQEGQFSGEQSRAGSGSCSTASVCSVEICLCWRGQPRWSGKQRQGSNHYWLLLLFLLFILCACPPPRALCLWHIREPPVRHLAYSSVLPLSLLIRPMGCTGWLFFVFVWLCGLAHDSCVRKVGGQVSAAACALSCCCCFCFDSLCLPIP